MIVIGYSPVDLPVLVHTVNRLATKHDLLARWVASTQMRPESMVAMGTHVTGHKQGIIDKPEIRELCENRSVERFERLLPDRLGGHSMRDDRIIPPNEQVLLC